MTQPRIHTSLREIIDGYDAVILDLWGVLHNGIRIYDFTAEALRELRAAGKQICLLSNVPRRLGPTRIKIERMGLTGDMYDHLVTSGETAHQALLNPQDDWHQALGEAAYGLSPWDEALEMLEGAGKRLVKEVTEADFLLAIGISHADETLELYRPALDKGLERGLPLLCANPDLVVNAGDKLAICAGSFAKYYEEHGGDVAYHGKPHAPVYQTCREELGLSNDAKLLAVGDSMATDIAGAKAAGITSCLIAGGIHLDQLGGEFGGDVERPPLAALTTNYGLEPNYVLPLCRW